MGTTSPCPVASGSVVPTASQLVALVQATSLSSGARPPPTWAMPGMPLVIVTTSPPDEAAAHRLAGGGAETGHTKSQPVLETTWAVPGVPLVIVTTTPWGDTAELVPAASQVVALEQATPKRTMVPETTWAVPGVPLVIVTTTPWFEELVPAASQVVALEQPTPSRIFGARSHMGGAPGCHW